jgi:hypothetical protein
VSAVPTGSSKDGVAFQLDELVCLQCEIASLPPDQGLLKLQSGQYRNIGTKFSEDLAYLLGFIR